MMEPSNQKICLVVTKSESVLNFRRSLIAALQAKGCCVVVIAHDARKQKEIEDLGVRFFCAEQENRSLNPFAMLRYRRTVRDILKREQPDIVFTFQLKPNTFGVQAAKAAGIAKVYCMVEGLGDVFIGRSLKWNVIRAVVCRLYRSAFRYAEKVLFLNTDDQKELCERGLVAEEKTEIVPGIGVDLQHFAYAPVSPKPVFLMVARMLATKGVWEYCACARAVRKRYPEAEFRYLGAEGTVTLSDLQDYIADGSIRYLGVVDDVRPYLLDCAALVLPSYREGLPVSVMEAEAVGRPIVTCDTAGCRDTVREGYNGFLVEPRNADALAERCLYLLEHEEEIVRMGENSRRLAEERFDQTMINEKICEIIGVNHENFAYTGV